MMSFGMLSLPMAASLLFSALASGQQQPPYANSYAPVKVSCPAQSEWVRPATGLNPLESEWVAGRKGVVASSLSSYLARLQIPNFNVTQYISLISAQSNASVPVMGLAISGGGFASACTGTAAMRALDDRIPDSVTQRTGGLLQCLTYMSGLSGGGFPTVSFAVNGFPTSEAIAKSWHTDVDRFGGDADNSTYAASIASYLEDVVAKAEAGFPVGIPDLFARAWGYEFVPGPKGGLNITWSSVTELPTFKEYQMSFPIVEAIQLTSSNPLLFKLELATAGDSIFDVTPFEFGAWSGSTTSFFPTKYLGTAMNSGVPVNQSQCVLGYDSASYVIGMTTAAFNLWEIEIDSNGTQGNFAKRSLPKRSKSLVHSKKQKREEVIPPSEVTAVVGAFDDFNLTLQQLVYAQIPTHFSTSPQNQRSLNPHLYSKWSTAQKVVKPSHYGDRSNHYLQAAVAGLPFPIVPEISTFLHRRYYERPVFFGCDVRLTTTKDETSPIVLWMANAPYSAYMNYTAGESVMTAQQIDDIFVNAFNHFTQGNGTLDEQWPVCLGCASIERSLKSVGLKTPESCKRCFEKYCWDGTQLDEKTNKAIDPSLVLARNVSYAEWLVTHVYWNATLASRVTP